ncbi:FxsA family protein [Vogesella urethralis]|jgi:UPF0716 protein FxsA|uniref:FxsA family protein n=1 Tax=Vogesella urethralis TaxID=2592656 RepID=UPI001187162B|nr:FxsA family protein [Vogesella urethralis]
MRGLLILFLLYPFLEMYSLFALADHIGGGWTLAWVIVTFLLGSALMRNSKLGGLLTLAGTLREGKVSLFSLLWPLRVMLAGLLLAIPGLVSDVLAIILMLPWKGPKLADLNMNQPFGQGGEQPFQHQPGGEQGDIIEGEYEHVQRPAPDDRRLH